MDSENLIRIVVYLFVIFGLYTSAFIRKFKKRKNNWDVSRRGIIVLSCGHLFITMLFIASGGLGHNADWVVSVGEFILYLMLMMMFTMLVVCKCVVTKLREKESEKVDDQG
ncbi:hypothetical protein SDC9_190430 [bioreactor metagenome]|uniref:Uncharacterized protein n=1 Tax=bioreactor metagenome TaxID=1076179 RepID=A0A645HWM3_9ZZZZ